VNEVAGRLPVARPRNPAAVPLGGVLL